MPNDPPAQNLKGPKLKVLPFDPYGDRLDLGKRWEKWIERFERDLLYNGCSPRIAANSEKCQMALLIYAGTTVEDIHDSLPTPEKPEEVQDADWTEYMKSKAKLSSYFMPKKNNDFATFELMQTKIKDGENTANYVSRLRKAAERCDFTDWNADKMIKCILISNMIDQDLRLSCLKNEQTLDQIMDKARVKEDATAMNEAMGASKPEEVQKITKGHKGYQKGAASQRYKPNTQKYIQKEEYTKCTRCGAKPAHRISGCPAIRFRCETCNNKGHYTSECFSNKQVQHVYEKRHYADTDTDSDVSVV